MQVEVVVVGNDVFFVYPNDLLQPVSQLEVMITPFFQSYRTQATSFLAPFWDSPQIVEYIFINTLSYVIHLPSRVIKRFKTASNSSRF